MKTKKKNIRPSIEIYNLRKDIKSLQRQLDWWRSFAGTCVAKFSNGVFDLTKDPQDIQFEHQKEWRP